MKDISFFFGIWNLKTQVVINSFISMVIIFYIFFQFIFPKVYGLVSVLFLILYIIYWIGWLMAIINDAWYDENIKRQTRK